MKWYQTEEKDSFIGKQVIAWDSVLYKRGRLLTITGWHDRYPGVLYVKETENHQPQTLHASRVKLLTEDNKTAALLLEGNQ